MDHTATVIRLEFYSTRTNEILELTFPFAPSQTDGEPVRGEQASRVLSRNRGFLFMEERTFKGDPSKRWGIERERKLEFPNDTASREEQINSLSYDMYSTIFFSSLLRPSVADLRARCLGRVTAPRPSGRTRTAPRRPRPRKEEEKSPGPGHGCGGAGT